MANIKDLCSCDGISHSCLFCGYNEHVICLTVHHIFPKEFFKPQPNFSRVDRYIILCPTCHTLVHRGILVGNGEQIIHDKINHCEKRYCNTKNIDHVMKLARLLYPRIIKPKDL